MNKSRCLLIIGFAFTLSYYDGCARNDQPIVHIIGPFPSVASCDKGRDIYKEADTYNATECWKVPEVD